MPNSVVSKALTRPEASAKSKSRNLAVPNRLVRGVPSYSKNLGDFLNGEGLPF